MVLARSRSLRSTLLNVLGIACLLGLVAVPPALVSGSSLDGTVDSSVVPLTTDGQVPLLVRSQGQPDLVAARIVELGGRVQYVFQHADALSVSLPPEAVDVLRADASVVAVKRQLWLKRAIAPLGLSDLVDPGNASLDTVPSSGVRPLPLDMVTSTRIEPITVGSIGELYRGGSAPTTFLGYDFLTGAAQVWDDAGTGEGALVAVIDTGIFPGHPMLDGNVIGGTNLVPAEEEQAIDLDGNGEPDGLSFDWDALENNSHGTAVSSLIAGHADMIIPANSRMALALAIHSPESLSEVDSTSVAVRLVGTAPGASLYSVKVFPYDGGSAPDARVAEAVDRLVTAKLNGELDVDVINMSLSGPVLCDGCNVMDEIVDVATAAGIVVVSAASNTGPSQNTVGTPGSALTGLTVGAAVDPLHTRVAVEVLFEAPPGAGNAFYPLDVVYVADFSARGPTGDGRVKPDIIATGLLNFTATSVDTDEDGLPDLPFFGFGSGTSFATPTVAGAAALLVAHAKELGSFGRSPFIDNVLMRAAVTPDGLTEESAIRMGAGFVQLPDAVDAIERGRVWNRPVLSPSDPHSERLVMRHNVMRVSTPVIQPGQTFDYMLRVRRSISRLNVRVLSVELDSRQNPFFGDAMVFTAHTAKRGGNGDYVFADDITPGDDFSYFLPEPGDMRLTFMPGLGNFGAASASIEITAVDTPIEGDQVFEGSIRRDGIITHEIEIPEGQAALGALLSWDHDWSVFPTFDLDLSAENGDRREFAASLDAPEALIILDPEPGTWTIRINDAGTVDGSERYRLTVLVLERLPDVGERQVTPRDLDWGSDEPAIELIERPRAEILAVEPNPFNPSTEIIYRVAQSGPARVSIYDVGGRHLRTLVDGPVEAGAHIAAWDGRDADGIAAASGVYFLRLEAVGTHSTRKLTLLQ